MSGKENLPTIKIGSKEYGVEYLTELIVNENLEWGSIDYGQCEIGIDDTLCEDMKFSALIHEILHACLYEIGSPLHKDEQFVESLGNMLAQVIKDNRDNYE